MSLTSLEEFWPTLFLQCCFTSLRFVVCGHLLINSFLKVPPRHFNQVEIWTFHFHSFFCRFTFFSSLKYIFHLLTTLSSLVSTFPSLLLTTLTYCTSFPARSLSPVNQYKSLPPSLISNHICNLL